MYRPTKPSNTCSTGSRAPTDSARAGPARRPRGRRPPPPPPPPRRGRDTQTAFEQVGAEIDGFGKNSTARLFRTFGRSVLRLTFIGGTLLTAERILARCRIRGRYRERARQQGGGDGQRRGRGYGDEHGAQRFARGHIASHPRVGPTPRPQVTHTLVPHQRIHARARGVSCPLPGGAAATTGPGGVPDGDEYRAAGCSSPLPAAG